MGGQIYNILPDVSGVLLAAVGVALVVAPDLLGKVSATIRWALAVLLVILGFAGLRSSFVQRRQDSLEKSDLVNNLNAVQATLNTFGPKLDAIIAHPESDEQRLLAISLQRKLNPKLQIDEPNNTREDPSLFNAIVTNIGQSTAKGKIDTTLAFVGPKGREEENALFQNLYAHEVDSDVKKLDVGPGYSNRVIVPLRLPAISAQDLVDIKNGTKVIYLGILETYFNETGRQFHTEKCMYMAPNTSVLIYCGSHNKID